MQASSEALPQASAARHETAQAENCRFSCLAVNRGSRRMDDRETNVMTAAVMIAVMTARSE
jgi:hypothetical protein